MSWTLTARDGSLWIGGYGGLTALRAGRFTTYTTRDGLAHDLVYALCEDGKGPLDRHTVGGLSRWRDGRFRPFDKGPAVQQLREGDP